MARSGALGWPRVHKEGGALVKTEIRGTEIRGDAETEAETAKLVHLYPCSLWHFFGIPGSLDVCWISVGCLDVVNFLLQIRFAHDVVT